jgi:hypothetical protein
VETVAVDEQLVKPVFHIPSPTCMFSELVIEPMMKELSATKMKSQLEETVQDLGQLIDHIGCFADW